MAPQWRPDQKDVAAREHAAATGLHAFLTQFLDRVNDLGAGVSRDFLVPVWS